MFKWLVLIYLVAIPINFIPGRDLRIVQELTYQVLSLVLILAGLFFDTKEVKRNPLNISIACMGLWFIVIWCMNDMFGWSIAFNLILGVLTYYTIIRVMSKNDIPFLIRGVKIIALFTIIYLVGQYLGWDLRNQVIVKSTGEATTGIPKCAFWGYKAPMGMYLASVIPLAMASSVPVGFILFFPLILSYSSGAVAGAGAGSLFFLWFRKRILFWIILPFVILGSVLYLWKMDNPMGMQKTRLPMWGMVIQDSWVKPLGRGLDSFRTQYKDGMIRYFKISFDSVQTIRARRSGDAFQMEGKAPKEFLDRIKKGLHPLDRWQEVHNDYLQLLYEAGFPSLIILGFIFYFGWIRFMRSKRDPLTVALMGSLIAFLVYATVQFPFHIARIGHLLPVVAGLYYIQSEEN